LRSVARLFRRFANPAYTVAPADQSTLPETARSGTATPHSPGNRDRTALIEEVYSHSAAGRYCESLALVASELSSYPNDCELLFARATVLFDWGRIREAREGFLLARDNGLARAALYLNLAWSCHLLNFNDEAEDHARRARELDPCAVAAHFGLGTILQRLKRFPAAITSYERALELSPDYAHAAAGVGHCRLEQKQYAEAEDWIRRALALAPENGQYLANLGVALASQGRYAEAFEQFQRAGDLESAQGAPPESSVGHGFALILTGQDEAAAELYRRSLPNLPDPRAHGHYALALLAVGQFREGWEQYESRWLQDPHLANRPGFTQPTWAGQDLAGKTILLRAEQGIGDIVQFARFALVFKQLGATVVLQVRAPIEQLAHGFSGVDVVFAPPTPAPPFDYYIHLMSIPHALGVELGTIPAAVPYLRVDALRLKKWAPKIEAPGLRVGLAWAGNPDHPRDADRSMSLEALNVLWGLQGVRYFSLQKTLRPGELDKFPTETTLVNLGPDLGNFADTAAAIEQMDLVISVDTAVAHLAGALGKPVWLMLPEIGDYRWLKGRDDSPWYPTMRLFRQRQQGQWSEVITRVRASLAEALRTYILAGTSTSPSSPENPAPGKTATATVQRATAGDLKFIARATETRYGIMQFLPDGSKAAQSISWYGEFLQPQLDLLTRLLRPGAHIVEAGSGIGVHALSLAAIAGAEGHLVLYEPRPVIQRILRQNLQINGVAQRVTLMRHDLSGPSVATQERGQVASGNTASRVSPAAEFRTETLDELLLARLDLLKIQASSNAAGILEGADDTMWRLRPMLFVAEEDEVAITDLARRTRAFGYRCWRIETPFFNPSNFNCRVTDVFDGEGVLALLAVPEEVDCAIPMDGCVAVSNDDSVSRQELASHFVFLP
jgi:FkbM family methyltransferase